MKNTLEIDPYCPLAGYPEKRKPLEALGFTKFEHLLFEIYVSELRAAFADPLNAGLTDKQKAKKAVDISLMATNTFFNQVND